MDTSQATENHAGLVWISGYTSAGKSTVARKVKEALDRQGINAILLDGAHLRAIFGGVFGYEAEQRRELAKAYMRLSSNLSSQGYVVILAAIAMYEEAGRWVEQYIPRTLQVFLDVPDEIRAQRDKQLRKNAFQPVQRESGLYDGPLPSALRLDNSDGVDPHVLAEKIVATYLSKRDVNTDLGRQEHWSGFYSKAQVPVQPSPFAQEVSKRFGKGQTVVEIGCGNGRDSLHFASLGCRVVGVDPSQAAITECEQRRPSDMREFATFIRGDAGAAFAATGRSADHVYSRFVLHAMPLPEEVATLKHCAAMLKPNGRLHIECRSINDPLARQGEVLSPTERVQGHYRRFIVRDELVERVTEAGFRVLACAESAGWALTANEDPIVIRLEAVRT